MKRKPFLFLVLSFLILSLTSIVLYLIRENLTTLLSSIFVLTTGGLVLTTCSFVDDPSASSEDSFDLQVLSPPWPLTPNSAEETSLFNRIRRREDLLFLLGKAPGLFWRESVKRTLDSYTTQEDGDCFLEFSKRDLEIRELRHSCYQKFFELLNENPDLVEKAPCDPKNCLIYFLEEKGGELDSFLYGVERKKKRQRRKRISRRWGCF